MDGLVMVYESILTLNIWFLLGTRQQKKTHGTPQFCFKKEKTYLLCKFTTGPPLPPRHKTPLLTTIVPPLQSPRGSLDAGSKLRPHDAAFLESGAFGMFITISAMTRLVYVVIIRSNIVDQSLVFQNPLTTGLVRRSLWVHISAHKAFGRLGNEQLLVKPILT